MQHEMTDAQLSERVCKALGIEPLEWKVVDDTHCYAHHRREKDIDEWLASSYRNDPEIAGCRKVAVYPNVLDGPGFLRVVERLRELGIRWNHGTTENGWVVAATPDTAFNWTEPQEADTLPRALAQAVLEWEASRG